MFKRQSPCVHILPTLWINNLIELTRSCYRHSYLCLLLYNTPILGLFFHTVNQENFTKPLSDYLKLVVCS